MLALSFYAIRIDPPKGGSIIFITKTSDQTRQRGHSFSTFVCLFVCVCVCVCVKSSFRSHRDLFQEVQRLVKIYITKCSC